MVLGAAGALLALAALGPSASALRAASVDGRLIDIPTGEGQPVCTDELLGGYDFGFRIDGGALTNDGSFKTFTHDFGDWIASIDIAGWDGSDDDSEKIANSIDFANATPGVWAIFVKAGQDGILYEYGTSTESDTDLTGPDGKNISHLEICYRNVETSPSPTPNPSPSASPSVEPSVEPTPTPTPTGEVVAATATPRVTPPATDTAVVPATVGDNYRLVLLALAALLSSALVLAGQSRRVRR